MGEIHKYKCKCGYEKKIFEGVGLAAVMLSAVRNFFPEAADEIEAAKKDGRVYDFCLGNKLALCSECMELKTVASLDYSVSGVKKTVNADRCENCGKPVVLLKEEDVFCPKCGKDIQYDTIGMWD